jgi:hypothetical protein
MCGSKRFCFMHLAAVTGFFSTAWALLKSVFGKLTPRGMLFVVRKKSHKGDELDILFSTGDAETISRLLQGSPAPLLKQLPGALGSDCPTAPHAPANPEPLPPLVAPQLTAPQLLDSSESQSRSANSAMPAKKRRPRPRAGRGLTSSRRTGCGYQGYRSASRRKKV